MFNIPKLTMKPFALLCILSLFLGSCSTDDEANVEFSLARIVEVSVDTDLVVGQETIITVRYVPASDCHFFYEIDLGRNGNVRTFAVIEGKQPDRTDCNPVPDGETFSRFIDFTPTEEADYELRFYMGEENGEAVYITRNVTAQ